MAGFIYQAFEHISSKQYKSVWGVGKQKQTATELGSSVFNFSLALLLTPLNRGTLDLDTH